MKSLLLTVLASIAGAASAHAAIRLPAIISEHCVLQANAADAIWGWAAPGDRITVMFLPEGIHGQFPYLFTSTADADGKWSGRLWVPAIDAGARGRILITSATEKPVEVDDVLAGEVWLGGGQSNMVYTIDGKLGGNMKDPVEVAEITRNVALARREAGSLEEPIRYFEVGRDMAREPVDDVNGRWVEAGPQNVPGFSAVAWNFAVALQARLHRPVGLIVSCVGGTPAELWMSRAALDACPAGPAVEHRFQDVLSYLDGKVPADTAVWEKAHPTQEARLKDWASRPGPYARDTFPNAPSRHYNAMIHGLQPYTIRGVIWFQADGNWRYPQEYGALFEALIRDWRAGWGETLPFYFVEMNNMVEATQTRPIQPHYLPIIREQQHAGLLLANVGMVAAIDLGASPNAHFPNKKPVGERLAAMALEDTYHLHMGEVHSPLFQGYRIEGSRVRLTFSHAEGLRVRGGGDLKGFAIRGKTGGWLWATGRIEGRDIVVWNDQIPNPVAVRYAWAANPVISVENAGRLPLFPFRTDIDSSE